MTNAHAPTKFRLGIDPMPDWFCDARSSNYVTTHNRNPQQLWGGPDYAVIHHKSGDKTIKFGEVIERDWTVQ